MNGSGSSARRRRAKWPGFRRGTRALRSPIRSSGWQTLLKVRQSEDRDGMIGAKFVNPKFGTANFGQRSSIRQSGRRSERSDRPADDRGGVLRTQIVKPSLGTTITIIFHHSESREDESRESEPQI